MYPITSKTKQFSVWSTWQSLVENPLQKFCLEIFCLHAKFTIVWIPTEMTGFCMRKFLLCHFFVYLLFHVGKHWLNIWLIFHIGLFIYFRLTKWYLMKPHKFLRQSMITSLFTCSCFKSDGLPAHLVLNNNFDQIWLIRNLLYSYSIKHWQVHENDQASH